jgi:hypothetical protein
MEIVYFEPKHYEELLAFSKKEWPQKPEEYLRYRLFQIPENIEESRFNFMVVNDEGKIIGCSLYMPTKARIKGKEERIHWCHDVVVEEQYRGAAGLLLLIEQGEIKSSFGFGNSEINFRIQKELGTKYIGAASHYLLFNFWSYKLLLHKLKLIKKPAADKYIFPDKLKIGRCKFRKISNVDELNIPDNGYWSDSSVDIECVRDRHFLKNRFFENFIKYHFYKLEPDDASKHDECYFVVRPSTEGGFPVLSIVDFRFNLKKPEQFQLIFKAAAKIGISNRFPLVTLRTSVKYKKFNLYPLIYRTASQQHIVGFPYEPNLRLFVTNADSDADFLDM